MKKFFKEVIFFALAVFIITNIISFLRVPTIEVDTTKYLPKDTQIAYFYTKSCPVCKLEKPYIESVSNSLKTIMIEADKDPILSNIFKIKGYPTIIYIKDGKVLYVDMGLTSSFSIRLKYSILELLK